jgi:type II secretory pathway pseudopilin PulG
MPKALRRFTLIELLVVISIIILALSMAIPAINKFTRGQGLASSGRLLQSAFVEARRSAITARKPHYLLFFREQLENPVRDVYGLRVFQRGKFEGDGYTTMKYHLPSSVVIHADTSVGNIPGLYGVAQESSQELPSNVEPGSPNSGCRVAIFDGCPFRGPAVNPEATGENWINGTVYENFFDKASMRPNTTNGSYGWLQFRRDGTIRFEGGTATSGARDIPAQRIAGESLYDLNQAFQESSLVENQILADLTLRQKGENKKRCYVDIDSNTGRVRYRVVALNGYSGSAQGALGTTPPP